MKLCNDIFVCADCHFGHKNILTYESRPFEDIKIMDIAIIKNWNQTVRKDQKVLILGDFSFYPKERTTEIVKSLNGYKMLIMGNHDLRKSNKYYLNCGFEAVSRYPIFFEGIAFSHEPLNVDIVNIHGHMHSKSLKTENHVCVSMERIGYTPIDLKTLENKVRLDNEHKRPDFRIFNNYRSDWYKRTD